jgi:chitinase
MQSPATGWISKKAAACAAAALAAVTLPFAHTAGAAGTPQVSVDDASVIEGDSGLVALQFHVMLDQAADTSTSVHFRTTTTGTATPGTDFDAQDITITFLAGAVNATISVPVHGDLAGEPDETVGVELYDPTGMVIAADAPADPDAPATSTASPAPTAPTDPATPLATAPPTTIVVAPTEGTLAASVAPPIAADGTGVGTIVNDDPIPSVSVDDGSVTEGNSGLTSIPFHVTLSQAAKQSVSVRFRTTTGSAATGTDYEPTDLTITFLPGAVSATIDVVVHGDTTFEGDETFGVQLSNPVGVTIAKGTGTGTILDDDPDPSPPVASIADAQVVEGDSGTTTLTFAVTLSETSRRPVTVTATTSDGTATSSSGDYAATSATVTFPPNSTGPKFVSVDIAGDVDLETDETFDVTLSDPDWTTLGDATATGTIVNDDAEVGFASPTASIVEGTRDSTNTVQLTATLSAPLPVELSIPITTVAGTATEGIDYQQLPLDAAAVFPPGTTTAAVQVVVNGDDVDEPDETFSVVLGRPSSPDRAALEPQGGAEAVVTITDDDAPEATTTSTSTSTSTTMLASGGGSDGTTPPVGDTGASGSSGTSGSSLPTTGSSVGNLVLVGLALVGAGLAVRRIGLARRSTVG